VANVLPVYTEGKLVSK